MLLFVDIQNRKSPQKFDHESKELSFRVAPLEVTYTTQSDIVRFII